MGEFFDLPKGMQGAGRAGDPVIKELTPFQSAMDRFHEVTHDAAKLFLLTGGAQAAGAAAGAGAAKLGVPAVIQKAAPFLGRTVFNAAQGAAAPPEGMGRGTGAALGAAGGALAEGGGKIAERALQTVTPLVQKAETARIGKEVGQVLPEMGTASGPEMFKLARQGEGRQIRTDLLTGMKKVVDSRLGGQELTVPALGSAPMPFQTVLDKLERLGDKAFPKWGTVNLSLNDQATMKEARRLYGQARAAIPAELDRLSPGAGQLFDQSYKRAAAQGAYLELLDESLDKNGRLDTSKMMKLLNEAPERIAQQFGQYWPQLQQILGRGQALPVRVDEPFRGTSPRSWVHGILSPRYEAGPGAREPLAIPPVGKAALSATGGRFPLETIGAATMAGEAAKEHIPFVGRRRGGEDPLSEQ